MTKSAPDERRAVPKKSLPSFGLAKKAGRLKNSDAALDLRKLDDAAEDDVKAGRVQSFETLEDFKKFLSKQ